MDDEKKEKVKRNIKKISTPAILKRNLINASLLLTASELLKIALHDDVISFFEFDKKDIPESYDEHEKEIEQLRNKQPKKLRKYCHLVYARWFQEYEALTEKDYKNIVEIWRYRNKIAHELYNFLLDSELEVDIKKILQIRDLVEKVKVWWFKEVEVPINPSIDRDKIENAVIRPGKLIILDHLISTALELSPSEEDDRSGHVH